MSSSFLFTLTIPCAIILTGGMVIQKITVGEHNQGIDARVGNWMLEPPFTMKGGENDGEID